MVQTIHLFQLKSSFENLFQLALEPDTDPQMIIDTFDALEGDLEVKAEGYVHVIKNLELSEAMADAKMRFLKEQMEAARAERDAIANNKKRLTDRIKDCMVDLGFEKLNAGEYTLKVAKNGGKLPLKYDEEMVTQDYMKITYSVDTDKIRSALDEGKTLDFAHYEERGTRLSIK